MNGGNAASQSNHIDCWWDYIYGVNFAPQTDRESRTNPGHHYKTHSRALCRKYQYRLTNRGDTCPKGLQITSWAECQLAQKQLGVGWLNGGNAASQSNHIDCWYDINYGVNFAPVTAGVHRLNPGSHYKQFSSALCRVNYRLTNRGQPCPEGTQITSWAECQLAQKQLGVGTLNGGNAAAQSNHIDCWYDINYGVSFAPVTARASRTNPGNYYKQFSSALCHLY